MRVDVGFISWFWWWDVVCCCCFGCFESCFAWLLIESVIVATVPSSVPYSHTLSSTTTAPPPSHLRHPTPPTIWVDLFTEKNQERISKIDETRKRYSADIVGGWEPQVDWSMVDNDHQFYELLGFGEPKKGKVAYNSNEHIQRCQQGGTAAMDFGDSKAM